jgi:2-oxoglutarate dehydrogenase complex dehydrogenase (E1) component-like enzyme
MGGWTFAQPRLARIAADTGKTLLVNARPASGSTAVGGHHAHDVEVEELRATLLAGL